MSPRLPHLALPALLATTALAAPACAQTSFMAPDGHNRFPAVTIFCPSGTGVAPCSFGGSGSGGGGPISLNLGGNPVAAGNRFPVTDAMLDALISGGALSVALSGTPTVALSSGASVAVAALPALAAGSNAIGSVSVSNLPAIQPVSGAVSQSGTWTVGLSSGASLAVASLPALPAGSNTIGAVSIAGTPTFNCNGCGGSGGGGTVAQGAGAAANPWWTEGLGNAGAPAGGVLSVQGVSGGAALPVSGTLAVSALPALPAGSNAIGSVTVSNLPATQSVSGTLAVASLPPLAAGSNAIGSVSVSNLPAIQPISGAVSQSGTWTVGLASGASLAVASLPALPAGANAIGAVSVSNFPATTAVSALPALPAGANAIGSVTVSNLPATQPVSAAALPLPAGAATAAAQAAPLAPVTPAAATATATVLLGCQAATTLPTFAAGQQGAVPCDTSGRPYVVTVPSANNAPSYLQAVSSGGATAYRAINAAASTMAAAVKTSSGMVYGYEGCNTGTAAVFLRLFPLGTAPSVGTSTPQITKLLPPGACQTAAVSVGIMFANGIALDVTSGSLADADTTAVANANQVTVEVYYK